MPARPTTARRGVDDGMGLKNAHFGIGRSLLDLLRWRLDLGLLRWRLDPLRLPLNKNHTDFLRHLYSIKWKKNYNNSHYWRVSPSCGFYCHRRGH